MQSEIFFFPPTKANHAGLVFAALGRALALATRFEAGCRSLSALIDLRGDPAPLRSKEALQVFSEGIARRRLFKATEHISQYANVPIFDVLNEARNARNRIVHEQSLGFENWAYEEGLWDEELGALCEAAQKLGRAELLISLASSVLTNTALPTMASLDDYPDMLARWVCSIE